MKILFLSYSGVIFDDDTPLNEPLGGTESSICYLVKALRWRGHEAEIGVGATPKDFHPDIVVVANHPGYAALMREIYPNAKIILWNHMLPDQPAMENLINPEVLGKIENIVYVSEKQKSLYTQLQARNPEIDQRSMLLGRLDGYVIGNSIAPCFENMYESAEQILNDKECRGAYTSTPYRGLEKLTDIREIPIDVYSSMSVYQMSDNDYAPIYEKLSHNPSIKLHVAVPQPVLAYALRKAAFLVYPCIWPECHSIAILEAHAAGLEVITTPMGVEEDGMSTILNNENDGFQEDEIWRGGLKSRIDNYVKFPREHAEEMFGYAQNINKNYTYIKRAQEWESLFESLLRKEAA